MMEEDPGRCSLSTVASSNNVEDGEDVPTQEKDDSSTSVASRDEGGTPEHRETTIANNTTVTDAVASVDGNTNTRANHLSRLLQQEKAHPKALGKKPSITTNEERKETLGTTSADACLGVGSHAVIGGGSVAGTSSTPRLRGIGKNRQSKIKGGSSKNHSNNTGAANSGGNNNTSELVRGLHSNQPVALGNSFHLPSDSSHSSSCNNSNQSKFVRGLHNNQPKVSRSSHTAVDRSSASAATATTKLIRGLRGNQPKISKSAHQNSSTEDTTGTDERRDHQNQEVNDPSSREDSIDLDVTPVADQPPDGMPRRLTQDELAPTITNSTQDNNQEAGPATLAVTAAPAEETVPESNNDNLVEAMPIEQEEFDSTMVQARPFDPEDLEEQQAKKAAKEVTHRRLAKGLVAVACLVLTLSLAIGLTNKKKNPNAAANFERDVPTPSPTRVLPPMENLETLYFDLAETTRETLYDEESPQYRAWAWLLNHPNITSYPEWRKKQIFALCTFYYAMEGPRWPVPIRQTWVDYSLSECSWINTFLGLLTGFSSQYLQTDSYDFRPCNDDGELQTVAMMNLQLSESALKPFVPPEISLLSSLSTVMLLFSGIEAPLEKMVPPELIQLPHLSVLVLHGNHLTGTIPPQISAMTSMRHLLVGENMLTGSIPTDVAAMPALQYLGLGANTLNGNIPSQLGLLTMLTVLDLFQNSLSGSLPSELGTMESIDTLVIYENPSIIGRIPSELGQLSNSRTLMLRENSLSGSIPTELAMLTKLIAFSLIDNSLTGRIPTELGSLTSLSGLGLSENRFSGQIPTELGLLSDLVILWIPSNEMEGSIPSELGLLSNLLVLSFSNNTLSGAIPTELWQLTELKEFSVTDLPLVSGVLPKELCHLKEIDCFYDTSAIPGYLKPTEPCALEFDCSAKLCGCDCNCVSSDEGNRSSLLRGRK